MAACAQLQTEFTDKEKEIFITIGGTDTVGRFVLSATSKSNFVHFEKIVRNTGGGGAHAETRFINVAKHLIDLEEQYTSISLDIKINYSPCGDCRSLLKSFLNFIRPALAPEGKLSLNIKFALVYTGDIKTTDARDAAKCQEKATKRMIKWKESLEGDPIKASVDLSVLFIATGPSDSRDTEFKDMENMSSRKTAEQDRNGLRKYASMLKGLTITELVTQLQLDVHSDTSEDDSD